MKTIPKILLVTILLSSQFFLLAEDHFTEKMQESTHYFNDKEYAKALPLLEKEAANGVKPSIYRLAFLYQNGLGGVEVDYEKAALLYQQAASDYNYVLTMENYEEESKKSFYERLKVQFDPSTNKKGMAYALSKMETTTPETKKLLGSILGEGMFGLHPYETNFLLPLSYSTGRYPRISSNTHPTNYTTAQHEQYDNYAQNIEVEFQVSLTKMLTYNLFGLNEYINFAYTQRVWWQRYSESGPFRETNYLPELFVGLPSSQVLDDKYGLKSVKVGYLHESNGQEGYRSRSWDRLYLTGMWQWNNLFLASRVWFKIPEEEKYAGYFDGAVNPESGEYDPNSNGDDNPNIQDYLGYGDIKLKYLYGEHEFGSLLRYNFGSGGQHRGAVDLHWSYPFFNSENTFWYIKFFNGYGESLIDYDRFVTKSAAGFSFSRELF